MYKVLLPLSIAAALLAPACAQTGSASNGVPDASPLAQAHPPEPPDAAGSVTLHDALTRALAANADLSAARHELEAVQASVRQAGARPNPGLSVLVEDTRRATRATTLQFNQAIELGGKRAARIDAASRAGDVATAELHAWRADTRAAVITAFFDVLAAQERVRLADASVALASRAMDATARRVAAGKASPVEETRARVAQAAIGLERNQARSELANARKRLAATWRDPVPRFGRAEGQLETLPALPAWTDLTTRLANAPAIARARVEVDRRRALAQLESSRRTPDVTVSVGVKRAEELGRNLAVVGLSMPLPLFERNEGNVLEALRRADKARDELASTEIRMDSEVAQAYERLQAARQGADALQREILPGAQLAYDAATKGFEFGKFGFLDVLDAQRTLLQAKSDLLRSLAEAHRAAAEIDRLLGGPVYTLKQ